MLHIIYGRAGTGKTTKLIHLAGQKAAEGKRVLFLVPEQFTVAAERLIIDSLGVSATENIEILNFRRLTNHIFKGAGGLARRYISHAGRYILMGSAFDEMRPFLSEYSGIRLTPSLIGKLIETDNEFKEYRAEDEKIISAANKITDIRQRQRLLDIVHITNAYNALLHQSFDDDAEDMDYCAKLLWDNPLYKGAVLCLDAFTGFTPQQLSLLEPLIHRAKETYVTLLSDGPADKEGGYGLFSHVKKTAFTLRRIAERQGREVSLPVVLSNPLYTDSKSLLHLERTLFSQCETPLEKDDGSVTFYTADHPFDEADFAAREICRLVREEGVRYRDIVVIARNTDEYSDIIDAVFRRYGIPLFCDKRTEVLQKPLILLILTLLDIICDGFHGETVLRCLKTGLWNIDEDDLFVLESYAERWSISGKRWVDEKPFSMHPRGFESKWEDRDYAVLARVNSAREKFKGPVIKLAAGMENAADLADCCRALYDFLISLNVPETMEAEAEKFKEMKEAALAAEESALWDILMDAFDQIAKAGQAVKADLSHFRELLRILFSSFNIGKIPTSLDEVVFSDGKRMRAVAKPCVFVMGLNEGLFPAAVRDTRLLNDDDRRALSAADDTIALAEPSEFQAFEEPYYAYFVFTRASRYLYLCCHKTSFDGSEAYPSQLFTKASRLLPDAKHRTTQKEPPVSFVEREDPAFEYLAGKGLENTDKELALALYMYYQSDEKWRKDLSKLEAVSVLGKNDRIKSSTAKTLYGENISISASKMETFAGCQFAYFCRYGLCLAQDKKADLAADTAGTFLHHIFEQVLKDANEKNIIGSMEEAYISERAKDVSRRYLLSHLGGENEKTARFLYLFNRLSHNASSMLSTINEEFSQSEFRPKGFEVSLSYNGSVPPLRLPIDEERFIWLTGIVDRVDVLEKDGKRFIRVVDYKSGAKTFSLSDSLNGLSVQMLLYLKAICQNGEKMFGENLTPAGILYFPAREKYVFTDRYAAEDEILKKRNKELRQNGLLVNDMEVLRAMEKDLSGQHIPVTLKADGTPSANSSLADENGVSQLLNFCQGLLLEMGRSVSRGDTAVLPLKDGKNINPCRYCDYKTICSFEPDRLKPKAYKKYTKSEVFDFLRSLDDEKNKLGGESDKKEAKTDG